jgi:hypothetical protein
MKDLAAQIKQENEGPSKRHGPTFSQGYGGDNGNVAAQTTEAAGGTRQVSQHGCLLRCRGCVSSASARGFDKHCH